MYISTTGKTRDVRIHHQREQLEDQFLVLSKDDGDTETLELAVVNGLGPTSPIIANSLNVAAEAYGDRSFYAQFWFRGPNPILAKFKCGEMPWFTNSSRSLIDSSSPPWADASLITPRHEVRTQWDQASLRKTLEGGLRLLTLICHAEDTI